MAKSMHGLEWTLLRHLCHIEYHSFIPDLELEWRKVDLTSLPW